MEFHWNYGEEAIVERKGFGTHLNEFFAKTLVEYAEPYTPLKTGALRGSVDIDANKQRGYITYNVPYAQYQYFTPDERWRRATPKTSGPSHNLESSRWLEFAWNQHKAQITGKVGAERRWHSK